MTKQFVETRAGLLGADHLGKRVRLQLPTTFADGMATDYEPFTGMLEWFMADVDIEARFGDGRPAVTTHTLTIRLRSEGGVKLSGEVDRDMTVWVEQ